LFKKTIQKNLKLDKERNTLIVLLFKNLLHTTHTYGIEFYKSFNYVDGKNMDKAFLERLGSATYIYVNFEKAIQERFNLPQYQNRNCHIHYTDTEVRDMRLAAALTNPQQLNFLTIAYQTRNRDFLVNTVVNSDSISSIAAQYCITVEVTSSSRVLNVQTRIATDDNDADAVVAFLLALSDLALKCLI
jgi:hypothetical protein